VETALGLAIGCLILQFLWPQITAWVHRPKPGVQVEQHSDAYNYLIYLPAAYKSDDRTWPLLVFLHGAGQRGECLQDVSACGPPNLVAHGRNLPLVIVSPQCPRNRHWEPQRLAALVEQLTNEFRIDEDRVYLTGYSMGGFGTWATAIEAPQRFAAIAPVCGGGNPREAANLSGMSIWAFHGADDDVVPLNSTREMVDAVTSAGGHPRFTIYPNEDHGICSKVYQSPEFFSWLLSQRRSIADMH
jgi:predicted peptidase